MGFDCEDGDPDKKVSPTMVDITKLITSLSHQISNQSNFIQDQLLKQQSIIEHQANNDLKLQHVLQANETFKRDVKLELENLRTFLSKQEAPVPSTPPSIKTSTTPVQPLSSTLVLSPSNTTQAGTTNVNSIPPVTGPADPNHHVMLMLADSFSKLSTLMVQDKSSDTKYDWPKFSGDKTAFKAWYLAIIAQLSLHSCKICMISPRKMLLKILQMWL
jgi:predicted phage tail protein